MSESNLELNMLFLKTGEKKSNSILSIYLYHITIALSSYLNKILHYDEMIYRN